VFCPYYILICSRSQFKRVPVYSFPDLRATGLTRPRRGVGVHPERHGAFSSALPKSIAELPSGSHAPHGQVDASLIYSVRPAGRVGARRVANRLDFYHCSLREQKESNPRANNALIFNNLQTCNSVTHVNSYTYKTAGGVFSWHINAHQVARAPMEHAFRHTLDVTPFQLSAVDCQLFKYNPRAPFSGPEPHFGTNSTWGIDER
jgi:hypothetical protein